MEAERPDVEAALDRLFASQGYGIRRRPDEHAGGKWLARYASAVNTEVNFPRSAEVIFPSCGGW